MDERHLFHILSNSSTHTTVILGDIFQLKLPSIKNPFINYCELPCSIHSLSNRVASRHYTNAAEQFIHNSYVILCIFFKLLIKFCAIKFLSSHFFNQWVNKVNNASVLGQVTREVPKVNLVYSQAYNPPTAMCKQTVIQFQWCDWGQGMG